MLHQGEPSLERSEPHPTSAIVTGLRWIAVLPGAFAASIATAAFAWGVGWLTTSIIPTRLDLIWNFLLIAVASGWAFVAGGTWIAPKYYPVVPALLAGLGVVMALSSVFLMAHDIEWVRTTRALVPVAASVWAAVHIRKQGGL